MNVEADPNTRYVIHMRAALIGLVFVAACGGVLAQDDGGTTDDGGIVPPNKDGGSPFKDGTVVDVATPDVIAIDATPCTETICNGADSKRRVPFWRRSSRCSRS